jgi:hypothetical protein
MPKYIRCKVPDRLRHDYETMDAYGRFTTYDRLVEDDYGDPFDPRFDKGDKDHRQPEEGASQP